MATDDPGEVVRVAELFAGIARSLAEHRDVDDTLQHIVDLAVQTLHGAEFAGMSLADERSVLTGASTGDVPGRIDAIQTEVGEGPCLDAIREHAVFETGNLADEARWPAFARRAHAETGVRSILALRLFVDGDTMGALNLYATKADAFDDADVALASVFAAHAAVALSGARLERDLERKARTRDVIGQAKGLIMARSDVGEDEAFAVLRRASQRLNTRVVDVAEAMVHRTDSSS